MSGLTERQKLYLDIRRCFESASDGLVKCDVACLETRTGIGYYDSVESAERAFFNIVMDCDAVYLEDDTLVLRRVYPRSSVLTEWTLKMPSADPAHQDNGGVLPVQTFDAMVHHGTDDDTENDGFSRIHPASARPRKSDSG